MALERGPLSPLGDIGLAQERCVNDSHERPCILDERHGHADDRESVQIVGRPIERIDDPAALCAGAAALFGKDGNVGRRGQDLQDRVFGRAVDPGDVVAGSLTLNGANGTDARDHLASPQGGLSRQLTECDRRWHGRYASRVARAALLRVIWPIVNQPQS
jgi:hypothetical protein